MRCFSLAVLICAIFLSLAAPVQADTPTITLSGTGKVVAVPDLAYVTIGIETEAATATAAQAENSERAVDVIRTLNDMGVGARDLRTTSYGVSPVYADRRTQQDGRPQVRGYRVSNRLEVKAWDLTRLGAILDAVVQNGANRIDNIRFGVADESALLDQARARAVTEARRKADLYAKAAGLILDQIESLVEGSGFAGPRMEMAQMRTAAVPIAAGTLTIEATVTITWRVVAP